MAVMHGNVMRGGVTRGAVMRGGVMPNGAGAPPIIPTTGLVANRGQAYTTTATIAADTTFRRERWSHPDGSITNIRSVDGSWYYNTSFVSANSPASLTFKRYIEYPADVFHQVTWVEVGGTTQLVLGAGVGARKSDIVLSSITGVALVIPAGTKFWERTVKINASSTMVLMQNPAAANVIGVDDGSSASDLGNSGTIAPSTGVNSFGALAYEGTINAANARSFMIVGDSLPFGTGDVSSVGARGGSGWACRLLDIYGYPYTKLTRGSQQSNHFVTGTKAQDLITALSFSDAIVTHALNDLSLGSRLVADILADLQTIYGYFTAKGARIYRPTMNPRTTSVNGWTSPDDQVITVDGTMALYQNLQDALRVPQANVDVVIELADQCMPSRDANVWTVTPVATLDGVHPNSVKVAAMAAALASSIEI